MARVPIGRIVNTHGLKGELRVLPSTDFQADRYAQGSVLYIQTPAGEKELVVERYRPHRGFDLLMFRGVTRIEDVEHLKGTILFADESVPVRLKQNEYRAADLIGLAVRRSGLTIGTVSGIRTYPQGDYLEIAKHDGATALVPFVDALVTDVDLDRKTVSVVDMEGLL